MISHNELPRGTMALKIIWGAMLTSLAIYLFVGIFIGNNLQTSLNEDSYTVLKYILYSLTCVTLIVTWKVRKFLLARKSQFPPAHQISESMILQRYFVISIISWALSESIGIYGLILLFVGKNITDLYVLILIAAIAMFLYHPSKEEIMTLIEQHHGVQNGNNSTAWD